MHHPKKEKLRDSPCLGSHFQVPFVDGHHFVEVLEGDHKASCAKDVIVGVETAHCLHLLARLKGLLHHKRHFSVGTRAEGGKPFAGDRGFF